MSGLAELGLRTTYRKGRDDIAGDFYLPVMARAVAYDRAVGYFRSTVLTIAWQSLHGMVSRGGRIRILCSPALSQEDITAITEGYEDRAVAAVGRRLREEVRDMLADVATAEPTQILSALVRAQVVDIKVAIMPSRSPGDHRIFHDKVGIVRDHYGATVVFKGSMNETWNGLAADGNLESVDVYCSWNGGREQERITDEAQYFETLWSDQYEGVLVRSFPDAAREELLAHSAPDWANRLDDLIAVQADQPVTPNDTARGRTLRPHQAEAIAQWRANGRRGIMALATGAGKTFAALQVIREALIDRAEVVLVVVPDKLLFAQWYDELSALALEVGAQILRAGAGHDRWHQILNEWTSPESGRRLVLATLQTARTNEFTRRLSRNGKMLLVADEVHNLGARNSRALLIETLFESRLGLSATPERAGDPAGTSAVLDYFGGVLEPRYGLDRAIADGVLTPYFYHPLAVSLTPNEMRDWQDVTRRIVRLRQADDPSTSDLLQRLYFQRARIVKRAAGKLDLAAATLRDNFREGQRWLIYCDDQNQLDSVVRVLAREGLSAMPYHSAMSGDRDETLLWLERHGGIVAAIRCLDEGVDIPSVDHALILASSKNPREFIQRRGRVLRRFPGKSLAHIYDAIVVPPSSRGTPGADPITTGELARAIEFAEGAENPLAGASLTAIAIDAGVELTDLAGLGTEDDDE